eukprot:scpid55677/ scgid8010/ 
MAFEFYDFDKDGYISEEDVSLVLSYADIHHNRGAVDEEESKIADKAQRKRSQSPDHDFQDRLENQKEIGKITEKMFSNKSKINYEEFKDFNTTESSETLLCVSKSLKTHIPCTDNFYKYLKEYRTTMKAKSMSPPDAVKSSPIAGSRSSTFKATSPTSKETKNKSFLFNAMKKVHDEKSNKYMKDIVGDQSTKPSSLTKEELEENILKNASKMKNPKQLRKERLKRQETITDELDDNTSKLAVRMKNRTKLKVDTSKNKEDLVSSEIQSPTTFLVGGEESKVSKI